MTDETPLLLHASCVSVNGNGLLITGPSGSGKSALALQLMALGADFVADDQTLVQPRDGRLIARAPDTTRGMVEARFVGLLVAPSLPEADVTLVLDMGRIETERLPPRREVVVAGVACALAYSHPAPHLAASILCWLAHGRSA